MPGQTISEKILSAKSGVDARAGGVVICRADCVMGTDGSVPMALDGDLIVAGKNFGCGSAMEVAVTAITGAGIRAVLARSFSRTYYRNAVNNGLPPVVCDTAAIREGDRLEIDGACVRNLTTGASIAAEALPPVMLEIIATGGLVGFMLKKRP